MSAELLVAIIFGAIELLGTLAVMAYTIGRIRGDFATKAEVAAVEKSLQQAINIKERESLNSHSQFITRGELEKTEDKIQEELRGQRTSINVLSNTLASLRHPSTR